MRGTTLALLLFETPLRLAPTGPHAAAPHHREPCRAVSRARRGPRHQSSGTGRRSPGTHETRRRPVPRADGPVARAATRAEAHRLAARRGGKRAAVHSRRRHGGRRARRAERSLRVPDMGRAVSAPRAPRPDRAWPRGCRRSVGCAARCRTARTRPARIAGPSGVPEDDGWQRPRNRRRDHAAPPVVGDRRVRARRRTSPRAIAADGVRGGRGPGCPGTRRRRRAQQRPRTERGRGLLVARPRRSTSTECRRSSPRGATIHGLPTSSRGERFRRRCAARLSAESRVSGAGNSRCWSRARPASRASGNDRRWP